MWYTPLVRNKIYFDFNATTPVADDILQNISQAVAIWGNPSSIHWAGQSAKTLLRESRYSIAQALGVGPLELVFTSGGTESNNTILRSFFRRVNGSDRHEFITSSLEHPSVLKTMMWMRENGAVVHVVPVDRQGLFDWDFFHSVLSEKTALVSIMLANNETGVLLPVAEIVQKAHAVGAQVHTDAVQAFGKIPLNLKQLGVDYASLSAHKFYSLKGTGVLYSRRGSEFEPLLSGGAQERHRRGGTENTLGIWALGKMAQKNLLINTQAERLQALRDHLEKRILNEISDVLVTHQTAQRLPNTSSLILKNVDGETLLMSLDLKGYAVSTGAACSSGNPEPSPVLLAIGLSRQEAQNSLRLSLGWSTSAEQVDQFVDVLKETVIRLRSLNELADESLLDKKILNVSSDVGLDTGVNTFSKEVSL